MNMCDDCFMYMLQFLDIGDISKLSQICKKYNALCKKHDAFNRVINYNSHIEFYTPFFSLVQIDNKYAKIYSALIDKNFIALEFFRTKNNDQEIIDKIVYKFIEFCNKDEFKKVCQLFGYTNNNGDIFMRKKVWIQFMSFAIHCQNNDIFELLDLKKSCIF